MEYKKRIVEKEIDENLSCMGAILIRGPKWCGKTTTSKVFAKDVVELQNPDLQEKYINILKTKPSLLLKGKKPLLIDEWQLFPLLWNSVKYEVDKSGEAGQFILTGSSIPVEDTNLHSGVGRFSIIDMKPMSLYESGDSNGLISLSELLQGNRDIDGIRCNMEFERIPYLIARGGWPSSINVEQKAGLKIIKNYINILCDSDISNIDGVKRNPLLARNILKSYARQVSTIDSDIALYNDIVSNYEDVSQRTVIDYIDVLKKLFIVEEIPAWNPNIRSKTSIRSSLKKTFVDPSLAVAALDCTVEDLLYDIKTLGLLFENLVNRDLSIYAKSNDGYLNHFRDRFGLECDNVIHFPGGKYALVEVKLGESGIEEAKRNLLKLTKIIKENKIIKEPEFMMIITGTEIAYTTDEGILIVPIGCLRD